jgi:flagellar hook assembly protein FlgD
MLTSASIQEPNYLNSVPIITALYAPKPNPVVNGIAHISYSIAEPSKIALKIYDASGRVVKTLVNGQVERGIYNLIWDGRDDNHRSVAEGIYFYTLDTPKQNFAKKLILTR